MIKTGSSTTQDNKNKKASTRKMRENTEADEEERERTVMGRRKNIGRSEREVKDA